MRVFNILGYNKHQQVINSVVAYFNEETSSIPYSSKQITKTVKYLNQTDADGNQLLVEKLNMAIKISQL